MIEKDKISNLFSIWKILLPVCIGIVVVALMLLHEAGDRDMIQVLSALRFDSRTLSMIILILLAVIGRDFGLTWRFRVLTSGTLSWKHALEVCMLCEFASCITPSAVGGSSLSMVFLNSKGVEFGRATTLTITTLLLDELFFVITCPIIALLTPAAILFASGDHAFSAGIQLTFWLIYGAICVYTILLFIAIIRNPAWIRKCIHAVFRIKPLRRWAAKADSMADNMVTTSAELHSRSTGFWLKAFAATAISWTSRFLVVNAMFIGLLPQEDNIQWVIFAREFVIWVILMVSPTPGGSGLGEWLFSSYYGDLISVAGMAIVLAIIWRLATYYIYLIAGVCVVPGWLKSTYARFRKPKTPSHKTSQKY